jgi:hypothetical protein
MDKAGYSIMSGSGWLFDNFDSQETGAMLPRARIVKERARC